MIKLKSILITKALVFLALMVQAQPRLVKDINPGSAHSSQSNSTFQFHDGFLYFNADDGVNGKELWKTDGTTENTVMVKDINSGPESSTPNFYFPFEDKLIFRAWDEEHGSELWITDGTENGTTLLKDINPGPFSSYAYSLVEFNNKVYFSADDGTNGRELWLTDGTTEGTQMMENYSFGASGINPEYIIKFNGKLYFQGNLGNMGTELIVSDGTPAGTSVLVDILPGGGGSVPRTLVAADDWFYFSAKTDVGRELWKSDGTVAGTVLVKDIWPGDNNSSSWFEHSSQNYITIGNTLYFEGEQSDLGGNELWKSDGTEMGTVQLTNFNDTSSNVYFRKFGQFGDGIIFTAGVSNSGAEPYISDGTPEGTYQLKEIRSGSNSSVTSSTAYFPFLGRTLFIAENNSTSFVHVTDGTEEGTSVFYTGLGTVISSTHFQLMVDDSSFFYFGYRGNTGFELWNYTFKPFEPTVEIINRVECRDDENGEVRLNAIGGYSPFTFEWSDSNIDDYDPSNLGPGTYEVTVTDWDGTSTVLTVELDNPTLVEASPVVTHASMDLDDGQATFIVSGGEPPYRFRWTHNFSADSIASNLSPGIYTCSITDNRGCRTEFEVEVKKASSVLDVWDAKVNLYPNPVSESLFVEIENDFNVYVKFEVFENTGKKLIERTMTSKMNEIDLNGFDPGFYIVKLSSESGIYCRKIVKI